MHADVIRGAQALVRAKVIAPTRIEIQESLAGEKLAGQVDLSHYWQMKVMSISSGDEVMPPAFKVGEVVHLFLAKASDGRWGLATPYAGVAWRKGNMVTGNFRISCTGSMFEADWYAQSQREFFESLHGNKKEMRALENRVHMTLREPPATFRGEIAPDSPQALRFFRQHAALEMMAEIPKLGSDIDIEAFLQLDDWQGQVSAVRALAARRDEPTTARLLAIVAERRLEDIVRTVAAVELANRKLKVDQLKLVNTLKKQASKEPVTLCNGSIMDPRFPRRYATSEFDALESLQADPSLRRK